MTFKKGRSQELIARRDQALLRRYHYWTEEQRLRFDDALRVLSREEFFLSEERILRIIRHACNRPETLSVQEVPKVHKPRITRAQRAMLRE